MRFHLEACRAVEVRNDGLPLILPACPTGACSFIDHEHRRAWRGDGASMIVFCLSRRALAEWAQANGYPGFDRLVYTSGAPFFDAILANLAAAMHRSLTDEAAASAGFTAMIFEVLLPYIIKTFGALDTSRLKGGLSGWQMRGVERLVAERMQSQVQLSELASVCGLSRSYFVTAFRVATGMSPHQWVIGRRIERARDLLRHPELSLIDVGIGCGFADQSHFTRTFTRIVGVAPGAWRKQVAAVERVAELSAKQANAALTDSFG